jgi:hypothetical protein
MTVHHVEIERRLRNLIEVESYPRHSDSSAEVDPLSQLDSLHRLWYQLELMSIRLEVGKDSPFHPRGKQCCTDPLGLIRAEL